MKRLRHIPIYLAGVALSLSAFAMDAPKYQAVREKHPPTVTAAFTGIEGLPALKVFETQGVVDHVSSPKPVRFALNDKDGQTLIITITKPDDDIVAGAKLRVLGNLTNDGKYESLAVTPYKDEQVKPAAPANTDEAPAEQLAQNILPAELPVENTPPAAPPTQVETPPATVNMPQLPPATVATPPTPATVETPSTPPAVETPAPAPPNVETPAAAPSAATEAPPAPPAPKRSERPMMRPTPPAAQRPGMPPRLHENTAPARPSILNRLRARF